MKRILLVEDNEKVASFISRGLTEEGFVIDVARDGKDGFYLALDEPYDVIILDLMLPHIDGLEILRGLRKNGFDTLVLILTAKNAVEDCIHGLNEGADDYMVKPFVFAELIARIQALLRRRNAKQITTVLEIADLRVDLKKQEVTRGGKPIELTAKEFILLEYLMRHSEQLVTRTMIAENVWDLHYDGFTNIIDVYVHYLRKKIDDGFEFPLIHTKRGVGYILSAPKI
ncbi:MAG: response regulator transcription factor [Planctomycetota bacterium]